MDAAFASQKLVLRKRAEAAEEAEEAAAEDSAEDAETSEEVEAIAETPGKNLSAA
jgi:hypothetical protein